MRRLNFRLPRFLRIPSLTLGLPSQRKVRIPSLTRFEVALFNGTIHENVMICNPIQQPRSSLSLDGESSLSEERVPSPAEGISNSPSHQRNRTISFDFAGGRVGRRPPLPGGALGRGGVSLATPSPLRSPTRCACARSRLSPRRVNKSLPDNNIPTARPPSGRVKWKSATSKTASDVERPSTISYASLAVALGHVQRNRLGRAKPLVADVAMQTAQFFW